MILASMINALKLRNRRTHRSLISVGIILSFLFLSGIASAGCPSLDTVFGEVKDSIRGAMMGRFMGLSIGASSFTDGLIVYS